MPDPTPAELASFETGDPASALVAAAADLRSACGWHIAPSVTETLTAEASPRRGVLFVESMHLTAVTEIRDPDGVVVDPDTYEWRPAGIIERSSGWWRAGTYEVDVTHGYPDLPEDARTAILQLASRLKEDPRNNLAMQVRGPFTNQYREQDAPAVVAALNRYRIPRSR